jgi:hypothetical protein
MTGGDVSFTYVDGMSVKNTKISTIIADINAGQFKTQTQPRISC